MDIYKLGTRKKVRFNTPQGSINIERLWSLPLSTLDDLAVELETEYEKSGKKSFLAERSEKDVMTKLQFDIVLDVLRTKLAEQKALEERKEIKEHNDKIFKLIAKKQDEAIEGKSVEELQKMLK